MRPIRFNYVLRLVYRLNEIFFDQCLPHGEYSTKASYYFDYYKLCY